jgi:hypothetical protein
MKDPLYLILFLLHFVVLIVLAGYFGEKPYQGAAARLVQALVPVVVTLRTVFGNVRLCLFPHLRLCVYLHLHLHLYMLLHLLLHPVPVACPCWAAPSAGWFKTEDAARLLKWQLTVSAVVASAFGVAWTLLLLSTSLRPKILALSQVVAACLLGAHAIILFLSDHWVLALGVVVIGEEPLPVPVPMPMPVPVPLPLHTHFFLALLLCAVLPCPSLLDPPCVPDPVCVR